LYVKEKKVQYTIPATSLKHRTTQILHISETVRSCKKNCKNLP